MKTDKKHKFRSLNRKALSKQLKVGELYEFKFLNALNDQSPTVLIGKLELLCADNKFNRISVMFSFVIDILYIKGNIPSFPFLSIYQYQPCECNCEVCIYANTKGKDILLYSYCGSKKRVKFRRLVNYEK
jgi:hypothetical protein